MSSPFPSAFRERFPELLVLDVDGVLTPNRIVLDSLGRESKSFFVPDGTGIKLVQAVGVRVALISGRASEATHHRARELAVDVHETGVHDKRRAMHELLERFQVSPTAAIFVGDDLIDLPAMEEVELPVAVPGAHPVVLDRAVAVTQREGGNGAVREVCEWILHARGEWEEAMKRYLP